jgi:hypothetical protein
MALKELNAQPVLFIKIKDREKSAKSGSPHEMLFQL